MWVIVTVCDNKYLLRYLWLFVFRRKDKWYIYISLTYNKCLKHVQTGHKKTKRTKFSSITTTFRVLIHLNFFFLQLSLCLCACQWARVREEEVFWATNVSPQPLSVPLSFKIFFLLLFLLARVSLPVLGEAFARYFFFSFFLFYSHFSL